MVIPSFSFPGPTKNGGKGCYMRDQKVARSVPMEAVSSYIPALDGIRGLAIILVLIIHLTLSSHRHTQSLLLNAVIAFCNMGWAGVDLFFVLSGFLITGILYDSVNRPSFFRNFYARRFLRIFPLYYGSLLVLLLLSGPLGIGWHDSEFILLGYLQNVPPFRAAIPATVYQYTGHFWSLAVEEQFYLVWPCLVFLIRDRKKLIITALILAAVAPILRTTILLTHSLNRQACYEFTLCRMDSLLIGSALALAIRGPARSMVLRFSPVVFPLLLFVCVGFHFWFTNGNDLWAGHGDFFYSVGFTLLAISFAALIGCALRPRSLTGHMFQNATLRWFGRHSYGIYVLHFIFLNTFIIGELPRAFLREHFHSKFLGVTVGGIPALLVTLICAWLSYRYYESPFLRLKRHFQVRVQPKTSAQPPRLPAQAAPAQSEIVREA